MKRKLALMLGLCCALTSVVPTNVLSVEAAGTNYNYSEALQKSILFYELQMSGDLPDDIRTNWKADSCLNDGSDVGLDLTGGWYDAGDNVKFNLPMSYTATMLGWSAIESGDYLKSVGEYEYLTKQIKWANDYFIKCHPTANEYYFQVGDGNLDHSVWAAAEVIQMERPAYKVDLNNPGSAVCAETAASLAVASIVFKESDPTYSATCLKHAKELLSLAEQMKSDSYYDTIAGSFYKSWSGFYDELSFASTWIYKATNDKTYLDKAEEYAGYWGKEGQTEYTKYKWAISWDDVIYAAALLLAEETGEDYYNDVITRHLDYWTTGTENGDRITYTSKGLAYCDTWGALRYASNTAFLALLYAESDECPTDRVATYNDFAKSQIDYALGSTGRSYVCGFGENSPVSPHHRTASGVWSNNCSGEPETNRHVLVGALVGGPNSDDSYSDERSNYTNNEVACDYNACFTGALAKLSEKYGGTFLADCNAFEESDGEELFIMSGINYAGQDNFVELKSVVYNHTAWPARVTDNLSFKYFVDITDVIEAGYSASDVTIKTNYNQSNATVTGLLPWDEANNIYYVNVDLAGALIYPGGQSECRSEIQYRIEAPCAWDYTKSPSFAGLDGTSNNNLVAATGLALYEGDVLVFGTEPNGQGTVVNKAPTAKADTATTKQGEAVTIDVLANDTDSDGTLDTSSLTIATNPSNGTATVKSGKVVYTPSKDFAGTDTFTYTVSDNEGKASKEATVTVKVEATNVAPVAKNDTATTKQGEAVTIDVLANDTDSDGKINADSVKIVSQPANGTVLVSSTGKVVYTPVDDFAGTDSFTYTVKDDADEVSNAATVTITVEEVEEPSTEEPETEESSTEEPSTEEPETEESSTEEPSTEEPETEESGTDNNDDVVVTGDVAIDFVLKDAWNAGYNAEFVVTNNTDKTLTDWTLSFDWESEIGAVHTGKLTKVDADSYEIGCMEWNSEIKPGEAVSIQFQGVDTKYNSAIKNMEFTADNFQGNADTDVPAGDDNTGSDKEETVAPTGDVSVQKMVTSEWGTGYNVELVVTNNTDATLTNWAVSFDWASEISAVYTGILTVDGNSYVIKCPTWKTELAPGESATLYIQGADTKCSEKMTNVVVTADNFSCNL